MNEVKKCSLSGVAFTMDVEAYDTLSDYLESLKKTYKDSPDGAEIVADIEARIAELILSAQNNTQVVGKPLILNIIRQMGSAEDISEESADASERRREPRIPRRLYRDTENAKLGGVCAGIGKYFDMDPVWIRLVMFLPLILSCFGVVPFLHWAGPMMGNLFGVFVICYMIMWFAVPAARTARQKLEMNGERITAQSIGEVTVAAAGNDPDARAKPIVAEAVSLFGKVVLILMKILAGAVVFGLILFACALIIGMFALLIGGPEYAHLGKFEDFSLWVPMLGILIVFIPVMLLIYVLMCLIASRKPGGRTVLVIFLLWLASIIACSVVAIREDAGEKLRRNRVTLEQVLENTEVSIDGRLMTLEKLLEECGDESVVGEGRRMVHISVPTKSIDITIDKKRGQLTMHGADSAASSQVLIQTVEEGVEPVRLQIGSSVPAMTEQGDTVQVTSSVDVRLSGE